MILVEGINFPYEATQLTDEEVEGRPEIAFGVYPTEPIPVPGNSTCRPFPGDADWPSESRWAELNSTLGGSLVRPEPPAGVCYLGSYDERACAVVRLVLFFTFIFSFWGFLFFYQVSLLRGWR